MQVKTILVTGGAGFIGSHLVDSLLEHGHKVIVIDNFDPFYPRAVKEENIKGHFHHENYKLIETDIRNGSSELEKLVPEKVDVIVHLAAKAGVRPSIQNPVEYQDVNVKGTQNMLEFARIKGVEQFVFASSSSVYGTNKNVPWSEDDHVLQPISPYASTKVSGELLGHVYSHLYDIRFIALRFFTVYGPRQRPDLAIHKFAKLISEDKSIILYGDGSTRRDYTYIDDIVRGIRSAISYDKTMYEVINLGNNKTVKLLKLVHELEKVMDRPVRKEFGPEQPGDVKQTWANIEKGEKLIGYTPSTPLINGLGYFSDWFKK